MVDATEVVRHYDAPRAGCLVHLCDLVLAVDWHDACADRACGPHTISDDQSFPPVRKLPHDYVSRANAIGMQEAAESGGEIDEGCPAQGYVAIDPGRQCCKLLPVPHHQCLE